jgi:hypothetical protein
VPDQSRPRSTDEIKIELSSKHFLVPDTPEAKAVVSRAVVRAPSLPSFAALGAAFRPGLADASAASVPMFDLDTNLDRRAADADDVEWSAEQDEDEFYLQGLEREAKKRREREAPGTPVVRKRSLIVPDT